MDLKGSAALDNSLSVLLSVSVFCLLGETQQCGQAGVQLPTLQSDPSRTDVVTNNLPSTTQTTTVSPVLAKPCPLRFFMVPTGRTKLSTLSSTF